jgi:hypothetical protein
VEFVQTTIGAGRTSQQSQNDANDVDGISKRTWRQN